MLSSVFRSQWRNAVGHFIPVCYIDEKLTFRILFYVCAVLFVGLDGWVFHKLFRKAEQKDLLNNAITCIAKGDTGFRLDTKKLTGKERTVGDHIK